MSECSRKKLFDFLPHFKAQEGKIVFDNNYRPSLWKNTKEVQSVYQQILEFIDLAFLTLDDEEKLWGNGDLEQCLQRTTQFGVSEIVIKRGAESCIVLSNGERFEIPAKKIDKVIDTTAAGDSFSVGYLAARLQQCDEITSACIGHSIARQAICHRGAIIPKEQFFSIRDMMNINNELE